MEPEEAKAVPDGVSSYICCEATSPALLLLWPFGLCSPYTYWCTKNLAWHTEVDLILEHPRQLPHITANQSGSNQRLGNEPGLLSTNHLYWGRQIGASQKRHHLLWVAICRCFSCDFWRSSVRWPSPDMFSPSLKESFILLLFLPRASLSLKEEIDNMRNTLHLKDLFLEPMSVYRGV